MSTWPDGTPLTEAEEHALHLAVMDFYNDSQNILHPELARQAFLQAIGKLKDNPK